MNISHLLQQRDGLLRRARLANLAYAYARLDGFARRIGMARLIGAVRLRQCDPEAERYWPTLAALDLSPAVVEEHFTDEDVAELAQILEFVADEPGQDQTFRLEELAGRYVAPIRRELEQAGVEFDGETRPLEESNRGEQD